MSVSALNKVITTCKEDGFISLDEAKKIMSPNDGFFTSPKGLGNFVDKFEHAAVKDLVGEIKSGSVSADPRATHALEKFVEISI